MKDLGGAGSCAASADEGIDLVNNPIICEENGEKGSKHPECRAPTLPGGAKGGVLQGNVHEIGGAVAGVCQQSQNEEEKQRLERECRAEVGPSQDEPRDNDEGEDKIVEDAAEFPESEGIGETRAKGIRRGENWGLGWSRWHKRRIRRCFSLSSTLYRKGNPPLHDNGSLAESVKKGLPRPCARSE